MNGSATSLNFPGIEMEFIPLEVLQSHLAILGKTGSGKTSTAKLAVEQVVAGGSRVCILDPIKSDWWGLTSSADGESAGLPFTILGGPHGHMPLHSGAGKALAEVVANGTLPLSILDMADFAPGGQTHFFSEFAPALLRKMRGILYLVIEEAHLFAPKERSGMGSENMSIHWSKVLSTAGRSKGIRLIVATQRTQSLHNAVLGSCETVIAQRLTTPADQDPVIKWLKANTDKNRAAEIAASLSGLETGSGWICSGEARIFERVKFARIKTYDNSATPTEGMEQLEVKTTEIDQEHLRKLIGAAVQEAEASDPKLLRAKIQDLEKLLSQHKDCVSKAEHQKALQAAPQPAPVSNDTHVVNPGHLQALQSINSIVAAVLADAQPFPQLATPIKPAARPKVKSTLGPSARKIVEVVLRSSPIAISFDAAARRAGISKKSSAYRSYLQQVHDSDEIQTRDDGKLIAAEGMRAPISDGVDPVELWAARMPPSLASMLRCLARARKPLSLDQISEQSGVSRTSSGLTSGLRELVALELVETIDGDYSIQPDLIGA